jgi:4-hydroxy-tetrahydrodipicolinate reductase
MKIALIGYGKMGKEIEQIALSRGHEITMTIDIDNYDDLNTISPAKADVAIEFTTPHTAFNNVMKCLSKGVPVVCGSTGWNDKLPDAHKACNENNTSFFWTSNYSLGVNLFFKLNEHLARVMNQFNNYEPSIKEIHHIHKKDAPSGTAITLAEGLLKNFDAKNEWKLFPEKGKNSLSIEAERTGEVPGTHIIKYDSAVDYIEITHCAKNRQGLAFGAVLAAEFIQNKKGVFGMDDLLKL